MGKKKVASGAGKVSRSVITGDISDIRDSQIAVGEHINQTLNIFYVYGRSLKEGKFDEIPGKEREELNVHLSRIKEAESSGIKLPTNAYYALGLSAYYERDLNTAESYLTKVVEQNPNNLQARNLLCTIYPIIKSIPISRDLLALMEESRKACQEKDIPYRTANLLLVLLQMPNSLTKQSMNRIEENFGQKLHEALEFYVVNEQPRLETGKRYIPFDWLERKDIELAQREAFVEKYPVVTQKHLLLGILQSDSKTTKEIREKLGNKFNNLLEIIRKEPPSIINNLGTPGNIVQRRNL